MTSKKLQPLMKDEPTVRVSTTVEGRLLDHMTRLAEHNGITVSDLMRHALWSTCHSRINWATGEPDAIWPESAI